MQDKYSPSDVEQAAQAHWRATHAYKTTENDPRYPKGKFYACSMLPYPSGRLHMGHVRNYTINDVMYRYLRMNGYNVLQPMGWDAFGMPAENAAMSHHVPPAKWTYANIAYMKEQLESMGFGIDWSREVTACRPDYYKWNQWMFLKMLEKGVIYQKTGTVNWDPVDQTVLANEQVVDGRGWRSGALIEKREIPMYYARITDYAEELLDYVENRLPGWPERVRIMQANWIGKSTGVRFAFPHDIRDENGQLIGEGKLWVFTTRADTIKGVTFCTVAPEHELAAFAARNNPKLAEFIQACKKGSVIEADLATMEKKGMPTGLYVSHPLTGQLVAVWVGNYVLMSYGDGAVMAVPAHDERDFAFAHKYGLPIRQVIAVEGKTFSEQAWQDWYADKENGYCINSGRYDGLRHQEAVDAIAQTLSAMKLGEKTTTWRLRDWGISRQRYWGTPIPIIHCPDCGAVPVPEKDLPVILPEELVPDGTGNPLSRDAAFLNVPCPKCGQAARRETDTMDTFVDSCWYFMRYCCPDAKEAMTDSRTDHWMPMDQYIGGIEHAVMHLLYARFWTKVMRDMGLVKFDEPFVKLLTQGMVLNETYYREEASGRKTWFNPDEVELNLDEKGRPIAATLKKDGLPVAIGGTEKMSKSKNNGIDPQAQIEQYGADTARLFTMFASPPEQTLEWSGASVEGAQRFLRRVWAYAYAHADAIATAPDALSGLSEAHRQLRFKIHQVLQQANHDYARTQYNTVVSACMIMLNTLESTKLENSPASAAVIRESFAIFLRVLYPVVPHITYILWQELGYVKTWGEILDAPWPQVDAAALEQTEISLVIQVNGKLRGNMRIAKDADKATIEAAALANENVARFITSPPKKIIVVPGKLVNLVI